MQVRRLHCCKMWSVALVLHQKHVSNTSLCHYDLIQVPLSPSGLSIAKRTRLLEESFALEPIYALLVCVVSVLVIVFVDPYGYRLFLSLTPSGPPRFLVGDCIVVPSCDNMVIFDMFIQPAGRPGLLFGCDDISFDAKVTCSSG